jgi:argininosuccinate lyase
MSFRDAYLKISNSIKEGKFDNIKTNKQTLIGSIHNLCLDKIQNKMNNFY